MRRLLTAVACLAVCFFVQFVSILGGLPWAIAGGAFIAALFLLLVMFFELELSFAWLEYVLPVVASLAATVVAFAGGTIKDPLAWWAPAAAGIVSGTWCIYRAQTRRRCALCDRRLGSSELAFECPRCGLEACADVCWDS